MSVILGKASDGRHFLGGGGGGPGITTPGTGFINVTLGEVEIVAKAEDTEIAVEIQADEVTAAIQDVAITATPQQDPIAVTVFPETIVAKPED